MRCKFANKNRTRNLSWILVIVTSVVCGLILFSTLPKNIKGRTADALWTAHAEKQTDGECQPICSTKECVIASNLIWNSVDPSSNPCENFFTFSCGNFLSNYDEDDDYSLLWDGQNERLKINMKDVLEKLRAKPDSPAGKVATVFDSCMNEYSREVNAVPTILQFLSRVGISNWPDLPQDFGFSKSLENVLGILAVYEELRFVTFLSAGSNQVPERERSYNLTVISRPPHNIDDVMYQNIINYTLEYFGLEENVVENIWKDMRAVHSVHKRLIKEQDELLQRCNDEGMDMHVNCFEDLPEGMRLLCDTIKVIIKKSRMGPAYSRKRITIPCDHSHYVENIFALMGNFTERSIAHYITIGFLFAHLKDMNLHFREKVLDTFGDLKDYRGPGVSVNSLDHCFYYISRNMYEALVLEYAQQKLPEELLREAREWTREVIEEAIRITLEQTWNDENARIEMRNEIENLTSTIDNDVINLNTTMASIRKYRNFFPTRESFLWNVLEFQKSLFSFNMANYRLRQIWWTPFLMNMFYADNQIIMGYGMLQPPVFQAGRPKFLNLAALGVMLGHEIGHHVAGVFEENAPDNETQQILEAKKDCLERQYFNFRLENIGKNVLGNQTFMENVADGFGLRVAERILQKYLSNIIGSSEELLPGLNYSMEQLFYIVFGQLWCRVTSKKMEEFTYREDPHAANRFRLIGVLQNSRTFSESFSCSEGSYMNPAQKCFFYE